MFLIVSRLFPVRHMMVCSLMSVLLLDDLFLLFDCDVTHAVVSVEMFTTLNMNIFECIPRYCVGIDYRPVFHDETLLIS